MSQIALHHEYNGCDAAPGHRVAVISGGTGGIGAAIALRLARTDVRVVIAARSEPMITATVERIRAQGGTALCCPVDLTIAGSGETAVGRAIGAFSRLDILINCAGSTKRGDFLDLSEGDWIDGYAVKLHGAVRLSRAAWPWLKETRGSIVNIAGVGARTPGEMFSIGGSVNAAMLAFTKSLAEKGIDDGIQVNAVNPGPVMTERLKTLYSLPKGNGAETQAAVKDLIRKLGVTQVCEPDDIAELVTYILSPQGRALHGSLIDIDGGATKGL